MVNMNMGSGTERVDAEGYTSKIVEVTGGIKYFNVDGVLDLNMFVNLERLGGSMEVVVSVAAQQHTAGEGQVDHAYMVLVYPS